MPTSAPPAPAFEGVDSLDADFVRQRALVGAANPVIARMLPELEAILTGPHAVSPIVDRLERAWRERRFTAYYDRPLLLLAALRADALAAGAKHPLARALADRDPDPEAITRDALLAALRPDALALYLALATRRVQTNEVSRAVAWRWLAHLAGLDDGARPLALVDVGCSGGLNLCADDLAGAWTERFGGAVPVVSSPRIVARVGYDQQPLDFTSEEDVAWGRACIWPGDRRRLDAFDAAVARRRALGSGVELHRLSAGSVPAKLVALQRALPPETVVFAYQTCVREYLDSRQRAHYVDGMTSWISRAPERSAAWIELEVVPDDTGDGHPAVISAHVPDKGAMRSFMLARCSYHPTDLIVRRPAAAAFAESFRG